MLFDVPTFGARPDTFVLCAEERSLANAHRTAILLMGEGSHAAREVYEELLEDYPASALPWVLAGHWRGPVEVALSQLDFSTRASWTATKDGKVEQYAKRIAGGRVKPVVLVQRPGNPLLEIVDGHHRVLACEKLGISCFAYICKVHTDNGPWTDLHNMQRKGSSKNGEPSRIDPSRVYSSEQGYPTDERALEAMTGREAGFAERVGDAALAIVVNAAGEVACVSRPEPEHEMSIPGGMVDPGETAMQAAARELREETGLVGDGLDGDGLWRHIGDFKSPTDGRKVSVFRLCGWTGYLQPLEAGTRVHWMRPGDLLAQAKLYGATVKELLDLGAFDVASPFSDVSVGDVHVPTGGHFRRGPATEPKQMSVLTAKARKRIPKKYFALPKEEKYPIEDASHLHNAASRLEGEKAKGSISSAKYDEAKRNIARRARQLGVESKYNEKKKVTSSAGGVRVHGYLGKGGHLHVRSMSQLGPRAVGDIASFSPEVVATLKLSDAAAKMHWIELGAPGRYKGHPAGDINLTREVFAEIVKNFNADKAKNPNRNIPIDFNHASEQDPTSGSIPKNGTPAQGWIHDLRLDDRGHLYGLVKWGDKAREYILSGQYQGISPAIRFGSKDKVTGEPIGARLSSAGLTNQPFLDLARLVASENQKEATALAATGPRQLTLMGGYAHAPHEYMPKLKELFGLHEAASAAQCSEVLDNIRDKFAACGGNPNATHPDGTNLAKYCFGMRDLVGAAPGADWDEDIFDVIEGLIDEAIRQHEALYHPDGPPLATSDENDLDGSGEMSMDDVQKITTLLSESQGKLVTATTEIATLTTKLTMSEQAFTAEKTARSAADQQVTALTAQFSAQAAELATLKAKLADQQKVIDAQVDAEIAADVTACIAAYSDTKGTKEEMRVQLTEFRKLLPAQFSAMYPKIPASQAHLQRHVVAGGDKREPVVARTGETEPVKIDKASLAFAISRKGIMTLGDAQSAVLKMSEKQLIKAAKDHLGLELEAATV